MGLLGLGGEEVQAMKNGCRVVIVMILCFTHIGEWLQLMGRLYRSLSYYSLASGRMSA